MEYLFSTSYGGVDKRRYYYDKEKQAFFTMCTCHPELGLEEQSARYAHYQLNSRVNDPHGNHVVYARKKASKIIRDELTKYEL